MQGGALLKELKHGCKMPSLNTLKMKLDEDHHRHLEHTASVEEGLTKVRRSAQQNSELADLPPPAATAEAPKRTPYPQAVRAEVEAARAGAYPPGRAEADAPNGQAGGRKSVPPVAVAGAGGRSEDQEARGQAASSARLPAVAALCGSRERHGGARHDGIEGHGCTFEGTPSEIR
ncbi:unnamed protein product [Prorocentrum cordatum]|uniref:Uncharacterized protein n=1 Tax=Prorocentrum cordatum TaxID=2364126 RepID=A0ABN9RDX0_9DINO|nr:unnamed protein product [Polarella glacialis]